MGNYVERDALRDALYEADAVTMEGVKIINSFPTADVRPVVHGKWEEDCTGAAICSVCGEYAFETSTHHLCGWFPNFCPNCGCAMEER